MCLWCLTYSGQQGALTLPQTAVLDISQAEQAHMPITALSGSIPADNTVGYLRALRVRDTAPWAVHRTSPHQRGCEEVRWYDYAQILILAIR
jgi:hypothetical protein